MIYLHSPTSAQPHCCRLVVESVYLQFVILMLLMYFPAKVLGLNQLSSKVN